MDKQLFLDIYQAFEDKKQIFIDAGVKPVAFIDRYRGQPLNPEQFEYFDLPAIFIERSTRWEHEGNTYNGHLDLRFHIVNDATWDMSNIATNKQEGLKYFTYLEKVREVLDNVDFGYIGTMFRFTDETIDTGVILYEVLSYHCQYYATTPQKHTYPESDYSDYTLKQTGRNLLKRL